MGESVVAFDSGWMKVIRTPSGYFYSERKGVCSVAVLGYRIVNEELEVLVRRQPLPIKKVLINDDVKVTLFDCPITGTLDQADPRAVAANELLEEGGYSVADGDLNFVKKYSVSTQTSEEVYCYICDLTGLESRTPKSLALEDSHEQMSHCEWRGIDTIADADYSGLYILYQELLRYLAKE